jgi:hypothetical protein
VTLEIPQPLSDHPELTVEVTTGIEGWHTGRIELAVDGDGGVEVRNVRSGAERRFGGRLEPADVDALGDELTGLDLPGRVGETEPDETPVIVALRQRGEVVGTAEAWNARRYEDARLDRALRRCEAIVSEVTGGRLPFGEAA